MRTPKTLAATVAAVLALGACAPPVQPDGPSAVPAATVRVTNNNWADMNVFVVRNGMRTRLGTVTSLKTTTFRVPSSTLPRGVTQVRIIADPIGSSRGYISEELPLYPGQEVAMTVQSVIHMSSVAAWDRRR